MDKSEQLALEATAAIEELRALCEMHRSVLEVIKAVCHAARPPAQVNYEEIVDTVHNIACDALDNI